MPNAINFYSTREPYGEFSNFAKRCEETIRRAPTAKQAA
jgi:predicted NAD-dependent protein-ADP-ribosyltransferase YbiA (DUF1768 family)